MAWSEGWLWLGGSLLLAVLWANLAWFFRQPHSGAVGEFVTRLIALGLRPRPNAWRFSPYLLQFLRLLYYIGVPFAVLLWGHDAVVGRLLGLQRFDLPAPSDDVIGAIVAANWLDWTYDAGWAVVLGIGAWALLALGWWAYRRALVPASEEGAVAGAGVSVWILLREAAYHEIHWAFYRNAPTLAWGAYWGVWSGVALVALEAALNPAWRAGLADPQRAPAQLLRWALAVVSGALFLQTQNLWLALILHWGVSWGMVTLVRVLSPITPERVALCEL